MGCRHSEQLLAAVGLLLALGSVGWRRGVGLWVRLHVVWGLLGVPALLPTLPLGSTASSWRDWDPQLLHRVLRSMSLSWRWGCGCDGGLGAEAAP